MSTTGKRINMLTLLQNFAYRDSFKVTFILALIF